MNLNEFIIYVFSCVLVRARGQYYEDPSITFAPVVFDWVRRGTYNMSYCSSELLNCWEIIKPDIMCNYVKSYDSVCSQIREYCDDNVPNQDQDEYWHVYRLREQFCIEWWIGVPRLPGTLLFETGHWTRRMTRALRARRLASRRRSAQDHANSAQGHVNSAQGHANYAQRHENFFQGHADTVRGHANSAQRHENFFQGHADTARGLANSGAHKRTITNRPIKAVFLPDYSIENRKGYDF